MLSNTNRTAEPPSEACPTWCRYQDLGPHRVHVSDHLGTDAVAVQVTSLGTRAATIQVVSKAFADTIDYGTVPLTTGRQARALAAAFTQTGASGEAAARRKAAALLEEHHPETYWEAAPGAEEPNVWGQICGSRAHGGQPVTWPCDVAVDAGLAERPKTVDDAVPTTNRSPF